MRRTLLSITLALAVAGPVWAQDDPAPDRPKNKDDVHFAPPKAGAGPAVTPPGQDPAPADGVKDPAEAGVGVLLAALDEWPAATAMAAIDALVRDAENSRPRLLDVLAGKARNARCASAVALSRMGRKEDAAAILIAAHDRKLSTRVDVLLEAAEKLDPEAVRAAAFDLLTGAPRPAQQRVARFLAERGLRAEDRPRLEAIMATRNSGARLHALRLLAAHYDAAETRPAVLAALDDSSPEVCEEAARLLAGDPDATEDLSRLARSYDSRPSAYAALALVLRSQAEGSQPFDEETVSAMIGGRGLRSIDPLSRGVAALVLGGVGYEERVPEIDILLESEILPALLDNVGGTRFFRDQPSLGLPTVALLEKLTGETFGLDVRAWRGWWSEHRASFVVRRKLRDVEEADLESVAIQLTIPGGVSVLLSTEPAALADGAVVVEPGVAKHFLDLLRGAGFFGDAWAATGATGDLEVTVSVGRRGRVGVLAADRIPAELSDLGERLKEIRARCVWQRYWDRDDYPRAEDFIRARASWFSPDTPPELRDEHLRVVIAEALDDIPPAERMQALEVLAGLRGPALDDRLCFGLMMMAEAEKGLTPFCEAAIRFLVASKADVVRPRLVEFLGSLSGPRATALLSESLAGLGRETVLVVLGDPRPNARRAAVKALALVPGDDGVARLRELLKDGDVGVRLEALSALGSLKAGEAIEDIDRAAKDEERDDLRAAALRALGAVGGVGSIPTLVDALRSPSVAVRVAAIQGLAATEDSEAIVPLLYAMQRDPYPGVVAVAAKAVVDLGGEEASSGLRRLASDAAVRAPVRLAATQALGGLGDREALAGLLDDGLLSLEASLALAELRDARAAPTLLAALAAGGSRRVLPALEGLSARTFGVRPAAEVVQLFIGWWEVHKDGTPTDWLISAMKDRGYATSALEAGDDEHAALGLLIRALDDESWAVRHAASRELQSRTDVDFGCIEKYTSRGDAERISDLWRRWWMED